jgi:hemerythrin superfamily protein
MQRRAATNPSRTSRSSTGDDAVSMLMEDHKKVQKLFRDFDKAHEKQDDGTCEQIAQLVCAELEVHTTLEEELFYPAAREALGEEAELIDEAEIEHQSAKDLIADLRAMNATDQKFAPTFTVLAEYVRHHVKEEEGEIFPKAKKAKVDMNSLGQEMQARKTQLMEEVGLDGDQAEADGEDDAEQPRSRSRGSRSRARVTG